MDYKSIQKIESHDAAGYETAYDDFSGLDDGYGNKVGAGDLSVQRYIERGGRQAWYSHANDSGKLEAQTVEGYDKEPFQSKAQMRKFFAMEGRGELPSGTARRWAHHTRSIKSLPERKG